MFFAIAPIVVLNLCIGAGMAAAPAAKAPASQPAAPAPAPQPAASDTSIARDQYHFPAPADSEWDAVKPDPAAESITYINKAHDGAIKLDLLAKDASVDPDIAMNVAVAIVKQLKQQRKDEKTEVVMQPKIEKDKRFAFIIHERYKVGDKTADQMHIYKSVGPRVMMLTVNTTADDADKVADIQKTAEALLDSVKFNRKAFKK